MVLFRSWSETIVVAKTCFFVSESGLIGLTVVSVAYLTEWSHFSGFGVGLGCVWGTVHGMIVERMCAWVNGEMPWTVSDSFKLGDLNLFRVD